MSTPPDWPGPNTTPPLHSQAKAFSAIGATDPWSLPTRSAHSQAPRPTRRLARRQTLSEQLARRLPTGLSARSPRSKAQQAARPPTFRTLSTARALVLSRFPFFWHKFTVVNDDGCLRKSLPHLKNSVNWGYAFFPNTMELMKSFTTANLCQEIVFRDQNQNLAPNSSQLLGPEQTTAMRPARIAQLG